MAVWSKLVTSSEVLRNNKNLGVFAGVLAVGIGYLWQKKLKAVTSKKSYSKDEVRISSDKVLEKKKSEKAAVDSVFFRNLLRIIKVIVPGWFSSEAGYLLLVAVSLVARTVLDVWMINNTTTIERGIIQRDVAAFKNNLLRFVYAMPFISIVNNVLKYGLNELKLCFRTRLSTYLNEQYLSGFTYYKMCNLDNRISNADQLLTQDVEKFCDTLAELYSNLSKPLLDICIYIYKLTGAIGFQGPGVMIGYLAVSGLILTRLRRPVGKMTVEEQHLEGEYRFVNSRLITNSEEIAFYQGDKREKWTIQHTFQRLVDHLRNFIQFRFAMGVIDNIIAKYIATMVGFLIVGIPFMNPENPIYQGLSFDARMEEYYRTGRMLVRMAQAIGRIVLSGRELTRLAGFTQRVITLMNVLKDLKKGKYKRTMLTRNDKKEEDGSLSEETSAPLVPGSGETVEEDHLIRFEHVPLVTPNGDVLVKDLTFEVKSGVNVLICGPNGCGKSSLFRILGELWPLFGGKLTKPHRSKLFYVPQRPYMTIGTLRDQIIYPDTVEDQRNKEISDEQLLHSLKQVHLDYILEREGGWDSVQDWMDVLSGGEKQRIAMARLFYHKPQFAILDECTSAVSVDVEGFIYNYCREIGITLFTVSHRKSLWKHHEYVLQFDGRGDIQFKAIDGETIEYGS